MTRIIPITIRTSTVEVNILHSEYYVNGLCFVVFCYILVYDRVIYVSRGYFTDTGAILRLPQCQWSNPEEYG